MLVAVVSLSPAFVRAEPSSTVERRELPVSVGRDSSANLGLPPGKPVVQQASFWRAARSNAAHNNRPHRSSDAYHGFNPPDPKPLAQPTWLLPGEVDLGPLQPVEPPGEAVVIEDSGDGASIGEVIDLAMAHVELVPSRPVALLAVARELAVDAVAVNDFTAVIAQCHRALDAQPNQSTATSLANLAAWAYNRRGELSAAAGDEHAAFEDFQEAVRLQPDCWQALHNRGVTLARYAKRMEALADFNRVVELAPDFAVARYNRGEVLSQLGRWHEAVDDYTVALQALPDEASLFSARGYALHQIGQTKQAATDYNSAIRLDGTQADAYVGRGNLYAAEGLYEQATDDFQQALRLDPRSGIAYRSVAWFLSTCPLQQHRDAEKGLEAALRAAKLLGEDDPTVLDTLAVAHANAGDYQRAITYEQRAIVLVNESERRAFEHRLELFRAGQPYRTK